MPPPQTKIDSGQPDAIEQESPQSSDEIIVADIPATPTVLIVHASVGSGHRSAAIGIEEAFDALERMKKEGTLEDVPLPDNLSVEVLDILEFGRIIFDGDKTASMFTGVTRPFYDVTWRYAFTGRLLWGGGTVWSRVMFPKFTRYIEEKKPIAVICTHITAANVVVGARMLTKQNFPLLCVPTDYEAEGFWPHKTTDLFCAANEYMAETLRPRKVPEKEIRITGIPTRDDFRQTYNKEEVRAKLELPQNKLLVLVLAGAYLPRPYVHLRSTMDAVLPYMHTYSDMHFVFIAGQDKEYAQHTRQSSKELGLTNVTVFEYVEGMASLMAASDLVICKSGGLVVTECLCAQVPMILLGRAYGQEKANVRMLTSVGAAMHAITARELMETLRHIASNPHSTQAMLISGNMVRRPKAGLDIARASLELAEKAKKGELKIHKKHFMHFYWGRKPAHDR